MRAKVRWDVENNPIGVKFEYAVASIVFSGRKLAHYWLDLCNTITFGGVLRKVCSKGKILFEDAEEYNSFGTLPIWVYNPAPKN